MITIKRIERKDLVKDPTRWRVKHPGGTRDFRTEQEAEAYKRRLQRVAAPSEGESEPGAREQPHPKLGLFIGRLEAMLAEDVARPRRERLTLKRLFDLLRREGYQGGYDAVRRFAGRWRREQRGAGGAAFVPLVFPPGDAYQFDWSHELVELGAMPMTVKVAHVRLCHSRAFYLRAYPRETQEMVFDAHARAFRFFGGTCRRGIYDNMSSDSLDLAAAVEGFAHGHEGRTLPGRGPALKMDCSRTCVHALPRNIYPA